MGIATPLMLYAMPYTPLLSFSFRQLIHAAAFAIFDIAMLY